MRLRLMALLAVFVVAGCVDHEFVIESDTSWAGSWGATGGSASFEGAGNTRMKGGGGLCWVVQKQTEGGYLRAYMERKMIVGASKRGVAETTASYGVVSGCAD